MLVRYLRSVDLTITQSWQLVGWCRQRGVDQFTVQMMSTVGHPAPAIEAAEAELASSAAPDAPRERATKYRDNPPLPPTALWYATDESLAILRRLLPHGLFTRPSYARDGWFEDPAFYRDGELMLGVVSHEDEGFIRLTDLELAQLSAAGFPTRASGEWI